MNFLPLPSPSMSFLFHVSLILILLLIGIPPSLTYEPGYLYNNCGKGFNCGNQFKNINYPFWGGDGLYGCGHPDFQLNCFIEDFPTIKIMNVIYRVIKIDDNDQTLKIARHDYVSGGVCSPEHYYSTTIDPTLYEYGSGYSNVTVLYGCPASPTDEITVSGCPINGSPNPGVYVWRGSHGPGICNTGIVVPVETDWVKAGKFAELDQVLKNGFKLKWKVDSKGEACTECTKSGGKCGYDSSNRTTCFCQDQSSGVEKCHAPRGERRFAPALGLGLAIAAVVGGLVVVLVIIHCLRRKRMLKSMIFRRKKTKNDQDVDAFIRNNGSLLALKQYRYSDVKKMTKSFTNKLGQGGYGSVYKGKLLDGRLVAVKVLIESKGNGEEFLNEVASISRTSHVNVVTLLGFCYERTKRALIYEFMPNGSLDQFIYLEKTSNTNSQLEWKTLYRIAVGIARGLEYLHNGCNTRILHFDIKPHNILLDEEFCPKISDFGLAKLCQRKESIISMLGARGTAGYIAPEVFSRHFGGVSYKSDVYSYGMMILEIVGGRRNIEAGVSQTSEIYFPHWIFKYLEPASTELRLNRVITEDVEEELARKMILVGLWCIQTKPSDRPSMTRVVKMLEGNIQSLQIPPKPFLSSPPRSPPHHSSTVSVSESSSNIV